MGNTRKGFSLLIVVILAVSSLIMVESAYAQTIPKPSVPEFTAKYVDHSYDVPTTYGTDPYNGQTIVTKQGEHVDNKTVEITIKNQPFTSFNDSNGNTINRFYDVRYKGSYAENWTTMFANQTQVGGIDLINPYMKQGYAVQDYFAQYTTIIYPITWQVPTNGKMDIQVEALEGYTYETSYDGHILYSYARFTFYGEESGWSNTQTVTIGEISTSPNPTQSPTNTISPTPTPTVPEFSWLILPLFLAVLSTTAVLILRKRYAMYG